MQRIQVLIDKLYQQKQAGANNAQLLATVQLIQSEIISQERKIQLGTSRVAVVMPAGATLVNASREEPVVSNEPLIDLREIVPQAEAAKPEIQEPAPREVEPEIIQQPVAQPYSLKKPAQEETPSKPAQPVPAPQSQQAGLFQSWSTEEEAPTLVQHQVKEVHELVMNEQESLNDRLKEEKTELGSRLTDTPIRDLRKGIGINDRYTFVNELFRGDEAMYERSIKTINGFNIFSEAEYWISRELKFKLGWDDQRPTVKHFYNLVKRRFS